MKKLLLVSSCLLFSTAVSTTTYAFDCKKLSYNCGEYGYTNNKATLGYCTNGWVACPIDANYRRCDAEASSGDFKFSRVSVDTSKSWRTNSNQAGKFIVAAGNSYCGVSVATTSDDSVPTHYHEAPSSASTKAKISCPGRKAASWFKTDGSLLSTASIGKVATASYGSVETRPFSYTVYGYNYTGTTSGTITGNNVFSSSNTTQPDCADDLGYVHTVDQCPNATSYIVCPFDSTAVLCDLEAAAGEIKFSKHDGDHNGWLQVNGARGGRTISTIDSGKYTNSQLGKKISILPNYSGAFLRVSGGNATSVGSYQSDSIKPHAHQIQANGNQGGTSGRLWSERDGSTYYPYSTTYTYTKYTGNSSMTGTETRPYNYGLNVFIYTGLLNVD